MTIYNLKATEMEIAEWFASHATCQDINIMYGPDGRPSGTVSLFLTKEDVYLTPNIFSRRKSPLQLRQMLRLRWESIGRTWVPGTYIWISQVPQMIHQNHK